MISRYSSFVDATWFGAGPAITSHGTMNDPTTASKLYVSPTSEFMDTGTLVAWEYYALTAGDITFLVCSDKS